MTYKLISVVGDGVTREWTLDNELVDGNSVLVDGAVVVFTQPAWNRVKMASAPAAGSNVTFKVKELASTDASGSTGGTGSVDTVALASAVAAAVQVPSASAIATAVAAALSGTSGVVTGQVVQFKEGQVPEGYAQIGGSAYQPEIAGIFAADSPKLKNGGTDVLRVFSAGGKLFTHQSSPLLQEVDANFKPIGSTVSIPNLGTYYQTMFVPLDDGSALRIGGTAISSTSATVSQLNTSSKTWISRSSGSASFDAATGVGRQAGNGKVYVARGGSTDTAVDEYDPVAAAWVLGFDTLPQVNPRDIIRMPSGKLLFVFGSAQYLFDPTATAGSRWVQVGSESVTVGGGVSTSTGAVYYELGAIVGGVAYHLVMRTFTEATYAWTTTNTGVYRPSGAATGSTAYPPQRGNVVKNPYNNANIVRAAHTNNSYGAEACYQHYLNYTPAAKVDAVKL